MAAASILSPSVSSVLQNLQPISNDSRLVFHTSSNNFRQIIPQRVLSCPISILPPSSAVVAPEKAAPKDETPEKAAQEEITTIAGSDLQSLRTSERAYITNVKSVSSYNWIDGATPTIAVPGYPALWNPPAVALQLEKDSGLVYSAQNTLYFPDSPMEPLFRALYTSDPSFDIRSVDVVSDRHSIRKLFSFVNPASARSAGEPFTINLELVRNTLLLCRHEAAGTEYIEPHENRGYGHGFERACTTSQIGGSTSHFRIITYRFCGLKFMIRHETDACVVGRSEGSVDPRCEAVDAKDGLSDLMASLSLPPSAPKKTTLAGDSSLKKLKVLQEGETIPLESILEIKTRTKARMLFFNEVAPQLWLSQTPILVIAHHSKGYFPNPEVEDVRDRLRDWERDNQKYLRTLGALIEKIITVMKGCGGRGRLVYDEAMDSLVIWRLETRLLPEDLYSKWDDKEKVRVG